jgi:peroxiredoxin
LQETLPALTSRGVRVVAVSVDAPAVTKAHAARQGYTFPILSDPKGEVLRRYDLVHEAGFDGTDVSRPAEFLIDENGIVRWLNLTQDYTVRAGGDQVLEELGRLGREAR